MYQNMHKRILFTGGGTGGHIYPLIAVAKKLKQTDSEAELKYFGPKNIFSFYLLGEGIAIKHITSSKIRRYFSFLNFLDEFRFIWSIFQALFKVFWYMPDVAFSNGGPGSIPVIWACQFYRIPIVIHESDSIPGKANLIASRYAKIIEVGFESTAQHFGRSPSEIKVVGNPVREEILRFVDSVEARRGFGLDPLRSTILILGGSQGATRINDFVYKNLDSLIAKYQIIHGVGNENYIEYMRRFEKLPKGYFVAAYFENNLPEAYGAADLVISRAGATTIFELAALGKPAILVPLPESASNHQKENAYQYAKTGAAIVIEQENLLINLLESQLHQLLDSPEKLRMMLQAAKGFYRLNTIELIIQDILSFI